VHCIYAIIDPRSDRIFYVGQTSDFDARRRQHIEGTDQLSGFLVRQMAVNGFVPLFVVLEQRRSKAEALAAEIFWIELMLSRGASLLNVQGVGGYVARAEKRAQLADGLENMLLERAAGISQGSNELEAVANGRSLRAGAPWTPQELRRLSGMRKANMPLDAMADALDRPPYEIRRALKEKRRSQPRRPKN
jgi:predicted GIY-YIG superfamily endonuclease